MQGLQVYEHNDIQDLSAFDIQFEKRRTGVQDLEGNWHADDDIPLDVLGPDDVHQLKVGATVNTGVADPKRAKMGTFKSNYKLINHTDYFQRQNEVITAQNELNWHDVKVVDHVYDFGKKVQRSIHFLEHTKNFGGRDDVCLRSDTFNSVDQSWKFQQFIGAYRDVCRNTLVFGGERTFHTMKLHTNNLNIGAVIGKIGIALDLFSSNIELLDRLRSIPCDEEKAKELFSRTVCAVPPKPAADQSVPGVDTNLLNYLLYRYREDLRDLGPNLWLVYNCLTHWSTHTNEEYEREIVNSKGSREIVTRHTGTETSKFWTVQRGRSETLRERHTHRYTH